MDPPSSTPKRGFKKIIDDEIADDDEDFTIHRKRVVTVPAKSVVDEPEPADDSKLVKVYTDGSCTNNGRPGAAAGYGAYFGPDDPRNMSAVVPSGDGLPAPTNQRAELMAILKTLELQKDDPRALEIYCDTQYSIDCITSWIYGWKRNGWKTTQKTDVLNRDLIEPIYDAIVERRARFGDDAFNIVKVKAHSGNVGNDAADELAKAAIGLKPDRPARPKTPARAAARSSSSSVVLSTLDSAEAADAAELKRLRERIAKKRAVPLDEQIALHRENLTRTEQMLREVMGKPPRGPPPPELVAARLENEELSQKQQTIVGLRFQTRIVEGMVRDEEARKRGFPPPKRRSRSRSSSSSSGSKTKFAHPSMFSDDL